MKSKQLRKWMLLITACILIPGAVVFSQTDATDAPYPGDDPGTPVPFDGGVSLLVAAGIGYGMKKAHDAKKKCAVGSAEVVM